MLELDNLESDIASQDATQVSAAIAEPEAEAEPMALASEADRDAGRSLTRSHLIEIGPEAILEALRI